MIKLTAMLAGESIWSPLVSYTEPKPLSALVAHVCRPDPDGAGPLTSPVTTLAYDAASRLTSQTDPLGRVTSWEYDGLGRLIKTVLPDPDGAGSLTAPEYTTSYDKVGNVLTEVDPLGNTTSSEYDGLNRLIKRTEADPDAPGRWGTRSRAGPMIPSAT